MSGTAASDAVLAAGAVCWKVTRKGKLRILVVHRTQHRDVSLPKGKLDPGETLPETAVREIAEETGLIVALGRPARGRRVRPAERQAQSRVLLGGRDRRPRDRELDVRLERRDRAAHVAEPEEGDAFSSRTRTTSTSSTGSPNSPRRAGHALSRSSPCGTARRPRRSDWPGPDATRPLLPRGETQALSIAQGIAAFRPATLISSTAVRCTTTLAETARVTGLDVDQSDDISQDAYTSRGTAVTALVETRLAAHCDDGVLQPRPGASADHRRRRARDRHSRQRAPPSCGRTLDRALRGAARSRRPPRDGDRRRRDPRSGRLEPRAFAPDAAALVRRSLTSRSPSTRSLVTRRS